MNKPSAWEQYNLVYVAWRDAVIARDKRLADRLYAKIAILGEKLREEIHTKKPTNP